MKGCESNEISSSGRNYKRVKFIVLCTISSGQCVVIYLTV